MKKALLAVMVLLLVLSECTSKGNEARSKEIPIFKIFFVPSKDPEDVLNAVEPIKQIVIDGLAKLGYNAGEVDISVSANYESAEESLANGSAHIGFYRVELMHCIQKIKQLMLS